MDHISTDTFMMKRYILIVFFLAFTVSTNLAQTINSKFFDLADQFFSSTVTSGKVDYQAASQNPYLNKLVTQIAAAEIDNAPQNTQTAFYINAYNLLVINEVVKEYPIGSVQDINGFFDGRKVIVAGNSMTLNALEKDLILKPNTGDGRYHFVLVCAAVDCPPITNFAYRPELLEEQLEQQTKLALNNPNFIKNTDEGVELSQIFNWYATDFGGSKQAVSDFINSYRNQPITMEDKTSFYDYDWSLNGSASNQGITRSVDNQIDNSNNANRYVVSSTIPKGSFETKIFNNLYSQQTVESNGNLANRSSFFTTSVSFLYGLSNRLNVGFATRYRKVRNNSLPSSPFSVFESDTDFNSRSGLTAFGPQIRYAPVPKWTNFSIQSSFVFPIGTDLAGSNTLPYIDWGGATWNTQFFNDFTIGNNFSLFTEVDIIIEDIGATEEGHMNRFSTPVTVILSYNPTSMSTVYVLTGYSPFWQDEFDYFTQVGIGAKYQFTRKFELELLATDFSNKFLNDTGGKAATYNLGLRFNF